MSSQSTVYPGEFFDAKEQGAVGSARIVVPILLDLFRPARVVDVGCGRGAWLRVFQEQGVAQVHGFDGAYVESEKLLIDNSHFTPVDLSGSFEIEDRYDLAICLEVLEHLPDEAGRRIVRQLTTCAPVVLFSAAIPGQPGYHHVNNQWPEYWQSMFAEQGFEWLDPIRRRVRDDVRVEWWYRQNILLFASTEQIRALPALQAERESAKGPILEWVHKDNLACNLPNANTWKNMFGVRRLLHLVNQK